MKISVAKNLKKRKKLQRSMDARLKEYLANQAIVDRARRSNRHLKLIGDNR